MPSTDNALDELASSQLNVRASAGPLRRSSQSIQPTAAKQQSLDAAEAQREDKAKKTASRQIAAKSKKAAGKVKKSIQALQQSQAPPVVDGDSENVNDDSSELSEVEWVAATP